VEQFRGKSFFRHGSILLFAAKAGMVTNRLGYPGFLVLATDATATRPATVGIMPYLPVLPTAASRLALRLGTGRQGQKFLPAVIAAKVERLPLAFDVESGRFVYGHTADGSLVTDFDSFMVSFFLGVIVVTVS
jgi:hypothetical protein